jgi:hypothetical protein
MKIPSALLKFGRLFSAANAVPADHHIEIPIDFLCTDGQKQTNAYFLSRIRGQLSDSRAKHGRRRRAHIESSGELTLAVNLQTQLERWTGMLQQRLQRNRRVEIPFGLAIAGDRSTS